MSKLILKYSIYDDLPKIRSSFAGRDFSTMDYHQCQHLLTHTPAARMLRLRGTHTALLLSFLHQEFKTEGLATRAVLAPQLTAQLADCLRALGYVPEADELPDAPSDTPWLAMASAV